MSPGVFASTVPDRYWVLTPRGVPRMVTAMLLQSRRFQWKITNESPPRKTVPVTPSWNLDLVDFREMVILLLKWADKMMKRWCCSSTKGPRASKTSCFQLDWVINNTWLFGWLLPQMIKSLRMITTMKAIMKRKDWLKLLNIVLPKRWQRIRCALSDNFHLHINFTLPSPKNIVKLRVETSNWGINAVPCTSWWRQCQCHRPWNVNHSLSVLLLHFLYF